VVRCVCCNGEYLFHVGPAGNRYVILSEHGDPAVVRYLNRNENRCPCRRRLFGLLRPHLGGCHRQRARHDDGDAS